MNTTNWSFVCINHHLISPTVMFTSEGPSQLFLPNAVVLAIKLKALVTLEHVCPCSFSPASTNTHKHNPSGGELKRFESAAAVELKSLVSLWAKWRKGQYSIIMQFKYCLLVRICRILSFFFRSTIKYAPRAIHKETLIKVALIPTPSFVLILWTWSQELSFINS